MISKKGYKHCGGVLNAGVNTGGVLMLLLHLVMVEEEKENLEKFGDSYREYMQRVPGDNPIPGALRMCAKKRG